MALDSTRPWRKRAGQLRRRLTSQLTLMATWVLNFVLNTFELTGNTTARYLNRETVNVSFQFDEITFEGFSKENL